MKTKFILCLCSALFAVVAFGQTPPPDSGAPGAVSPAATDAVSAPVVAPASAPAAASPATTVAAAPPVAASAVTPSASIKSDDDFDRAVEKKVRRHFDINFDGDHGHHGSDDIPWIAVPIVLIVFLTIFGLPVAVVGIILYFSFSRNRAMHKTVRMMVEKGQPVPEALLNPPPVVRQRSDLRRGIILLSIGAGLVVLLGALNDWEGGAWSIGMIPFLIGLGYMLVWKLDTRHEGTSPKV
jgi:hypothetical protein